MNSDSAPQLQQQTPITGVILAGGAGRRVQGADKGLLRVDGEHSVIHVARSLKPHCSRLIINANRNLDRYKSLNIGDVVSDCRPDYAGPLAGIEAALAAADTELVVMAPCDMPRLPSRVFTDLLKVLRSDPSLDLVYACANTRHQYLCAALRQRSASSVSAVLDEGLRAVRQWHATLNKQIVEFDEIDPAVFQNWNTPEDWGG